MPEISIVVPAYNAERYLATTLESVRVQTMANWELIVVNDGSTDATSRIAAQFAALDRRIRVLEQPNSGVAAARNTGLFSANADSWAIMFLDADDVLETDALALLSTALRAHPDAVGAHGQARFIDTSGEPIRPGEAEAWGRKRHALVNGRIVNWPVMRPTTLEVLVLLNRMRTPGSVLVSRELVASIGGFDTDPHVRIAEDYDLWLRLACRGDFVFIDRVVISYRVHEQNASGNLRRTDVARWYVHNKLAKSRDISPRQRHLVRQGLRFARLLGSRHWFTWSIRSLSRGQLLTAANQARHGLIEFAHVFERQPR
jgi:glycosyltransferase involved in cell wall biosynthesis